MTFETLLNTLTEDTAVKLVIQEYGMKFSTVHSPEYYYEKVECVPLLSMMVVKLFVTSDLLLEVTLA